MPIPTPLLRCCVKALACVGGAYVGGPAGGEIAAQVFEAVWDFWQDGTDSSARVEEVQALAQADPAELRAEVSRVVGEEAGTLAGDQRRQLEVYLSQIPATIRRTLRRPSDPTGTTVPPGLALRKADDLLPLLPPRMPRFKPGDRPLAGVDWQLAELLGVGGFGEVWKAVHPHFDGMEPAALKFCLDGAAKDYLLRHEAAVLNQVMRQGRHDGVVALRHTYLSADPPCLEYEYVAGGDLAGLIQEWHRAGQPPRPEQAGGLILRLAEVVGYMHRLDPPVVHRDLKPANVLVQAAPGGYALKVADFGIGGLAVRQAIEQTRRGTRREVFLASSLRGAYTPLYASPQQMRGDPPDPRDDVYALGVIWYQMLTGDLTKGRPGGRSWQGRLLDQGVPAAWLDLLLACVEDEPEDRPADANDVAGRLHGLLGASEPASPRSDSDASSRDDSRLHRAEVTAATQVVLDQPPPPFRFRCGDVAHNIEDLITCCVRHPDDAQWHLMQGHLETWLQSPSHDPWLQSPGHSAVVRIARDARLRDRRPADALANFVAGAKQLIIPRQVWHDPSKDIPPSSVAAGVAMAALPGAILIVWLVGVIDFAVVLTFGGLIAMTYGLAGLKIFRGLRSLLGGSAPDVAGVDGGALSDGPDR